MKSFVEGHSEGAQAGSLNSWQEVIYNAYYAKGS
jgi:hypothetical protein